MHTTLKLLIFAHNEIVMNRNYEIIGSIYAQGLIFAECAKICKDAYLCGDLASEVTIILMEKNPELIEGLNNRGELLYYAHRVAKNQFCSKTSPFYHKYIELQEKSNKYDDTEI